MKRGDEFAVLWLMHPDREQRGPVAERIERYRRIAGEQLAFELVPHSVAAYLVGVRINLHEVSFDEIVVQHVGTGGTRGRWFVVWFHETGYLPPRSPSPAPSTASPIGPSPIGPAPIGFVLPQICAFVGDPVVEPERTVWRYDCGPELNRNARDALRDALITQGWTTCGPALASETWRKAGLALTISESSLAPGDYPRLSQRRAPTC